MRNVFALITGADSSQVKHQRKADKLRRKIEGPDPWSVYSKKVQTYYNMSNSGMFIVTHIDLPTPFSGPYFGEKSIWAKPGYWQTEWNNFVLGEPSVYTGDKPLPPPYMGPAGKGNPPMPQFVASQAHIDRYKQHLLDGSLDNAFPF